MGLENEYIYSPTNEIYEYDKTTTFYHIEGVNKFVGNFDLFTKYLIEQEKQVKMNLNKED